MLRVSIQVQSGHDGQHGRRVSVINMNVTLADNWRSSCFRVFEQDGCLIICDKMSLDFLKGSKIAYEDSLMRSSFMVGIHRASCRTEFKALYSSFVRR